MSRLHELTQLVKKRKRVGRGGSRGGTSGKGSKGQKARSGPKIKASFEGGQMPLSRRLPKRGFNNKRFAQEVVIVNLSQLERVGEAGTVIDREFLTKHGLLKGKRNALLKVLGAGELSKKLIVCADAFSKSAEKAIADRGGEARVAQGA